MIQFVQKCRNQQNVCCLPNLMPRRRQRLRFSDISQPISVCLLTFFFKLILAVSYEVPLNHSKQDRFLESWQGIASYLVRADIAALPIYLRIVRFWGNSSCSLKDLKRRPRLVRFAFSICRRLLWVEGASTTKTSLL